MSEGPPSTVLRTKSEVNWFSLTIYIYIREKHGRFNTQSRFQVRLSPKDATPSPGSGSFHPRRGVARLKREELHAEVRQRVLWHLARFGSKRRKTRPGASGWVGGWMGGWHWGDVLKRSLLQVPRFFGHLQGSLKTAPPHPLWTKRSPTIFRVFLTLKATQMGNLESGLASYSRNAWFFTGSRDTPQHRAHDNV